MEVPTFSGTIQGFEISIMMVNLFGRSCSLTITLERYKLTLASLKLNCFLGIFILGWSILQLRQTIQSIICLGRFIKYHILKWESK